ncbi:unnamed protein product, partial [Symbiodinium pilosum]
VAPTAPGDATPGFTLPASPTAPAARQTALRPWPRIGDRFAALAEALRNAPAVVPSDLARLINAELECDEHTLTSRAVADAAMTVAALATLPPHPLSLAQAIELSMDSEGYLSAAAQAALFHLAVATAECKTFQAAEAHPLMETQARHPLPTLQDVPPILQAAVRGALVQALERLRAERSEGAATGTGSSRAWKLFILAPRMLLARTALQGPQGRAELLGRATAFQRGEWLQLLQSARRACDPARDAPALPPDEVCERKRRQACAKVQWGEVSRARQVLTAAELAPGNEATWAALTDRNTSPSRAANRGFAGAALAPAGPASPPQRAPGLSGMRAEHLKLLLQDVNAIELLAEAATQLAQARVPADIPPALAMARLTALRKPDGGVRGIATGD